MNTTEPLADALRRDLEAIQADLLAVLRHHYPRVGPMLIAHALIETTGSVCTAIVESQPVARRDLDLKLASMHAYVACAKQARQ